MKKEDIKKDVENWILSSGKRSKLLVPEKLAWKTHGEFEVLCLSSELLLERFFMPDEIGIRVSVGGDACNMELVVHKGVYAVFKQRAIDMFCNEAAGLKQDGDEAVYGSRGLEREDFQDDCKVGEYLDNKIEDINMTIGRWLTHHHEDYLRYLGPCHSQDDYGFQFFKGQDDLYHGEAKCFVYVVVKNNSRTHAVQLRIKDKDDNFGTRVLYPEKRPIILDELNMRIPYTKVVADTVETPPDAQSDAIRNITIDFTSDGAKEEAMARLAEAWLVAVGVLPSLKSLRETAANA